MREFYQISSSPAMPTATCISLAFWFQSRCQNWWHFRPFAYFPSCQDTVHHSDLRRTFRIVQTRWKLWYLEGMSIAHTRDHSRPFDMFSEFPIVMLKEKNKQVIDLWDPQWICRRKFYFFSGSVQLFVQPSPLLIWPSSKKYDVKNIWNIIFILNHT